MDLTIHWLRKIISLRVNVFIPLLTIIIITCGKEWWWGYTNSEPMLLIVVNGIPKVDIESDIKKWTTIR